MPDHAPADRGEGIKLQMGVALAEYNMARDAALAFRQMLGRLDQLALTALGLSIPLMLAILEEDADLGRWVGPVRALAA
jgi:hypothetical protein